MALRRDSTNTISNSLHENVVEMEKLLSWYEDFIENIEKYKLWHENSFNDKYHWFTLIWEKSIWLLWKLLDFMNYWDKSNWKGYYWTQCVLITNAIPFIYSSFYNILNWQYQIASTVNRSSFETLLRMYFINFYPDKYWWIYWKENVKYLKSKWITVPSFNVTNFLKHQLKWKFIDIYTVLSSESHSSMLSVSKDLKSIEEWTYKIGVNMQGHIDFTYNMNILIFIIYAFLKYIDEVLFKTMDLSNVKMNKEYDDLLKNKDYMLTFLDDYLYGLPHERNLNEEVNEIMDEIIKLEFNI